MVVTAWGTVSSMDTLLTTKFYIPAPRRPSVSRPQLMDQLQAALTAPCTLLMAPAGFGKTTLLSLWIEQHRPSVAWLALDEGDDDAVRFWLYAITSLQQLHSGLGAGALALLRAPQPPPLEAVLTQWINELAQMTIPCALILDDYHLITNPAIHQSINFLVDHRPAALHLIISSRSEPPLALARWRVRHQLHEVNATALRFSPVEADVFLNEVMGLALSPTQVAVLTARTEGWIAGLQLAALAMRGMQVGEGRLDPADFIEQFTGSHAHLVDYLVEEVLHRQPEAVQRFLLHTSILERLCGPLCDAVTGERNSQARLEQVQRANLFLFPLDQVHGWYRYHPLFAEALRHRLQQTAAEEGAALHGLYRRASLWHAQTGLIAEAMRYALLAEDWLGAADIIEQNIIALQGRGEFMSMRSWLAALPAPLVQARPYLNLAYAWSTILAAQYEEVERHLRMAELALAEGSAPLANLPSAEIVGQIAAVRTLLAVFRNEPEHARELGQQALPLLSTDNLPIRMRLIYALGLAERANGNARTAEQAFREAAQLGQRAQNPIQVLIALIGLAELREVQGQLHAAAHTFQQALDVATVGKSGPLPMACLAYAGLGTIYRQWHDLATAESHLRQAITLSQLGGIEITEAYAWFMLALVYQNWGDNVQANEARRRGERLVAAWSHVPPTAQLGPLQARLALLQGDWATAARHCPPSDEQSTELRNEWLAAEAIMRARILIAQGNSAAALPMLDALRQTALHTGRNAHVIEILVLQAIALHSQDDSVTALACLEEALRRAEPEGYMHLFTDEGSVLLPLLHKVAARGVLIDYVGRLLAVLEPRQPLLPPRPAGVEPLLEPLSERELAVLRLMAAGLKNQTIADELVVVLGTVKAHINHIYQKLGVENRVQAIERARALHLL
ncbi:MAG: LuxR C-terminal-related transcriptional regulator [Caldilineaceae bacterium]